jgi:hypothetical protein
MKFPFAINYPERREVQVLGKDQSCTFFEQSGKAR